MSPRCWSELVKGEAWHWSLWNHFLIHLDLNLIERSWQM
jgi:hypothetical protein